MTTPVLWGGPFDGMSYPGPPREWLDIRAPAVAMEGDTPTGETVDLEPIACRYVWSVTRNRYEWEGLRHG